MENEVLLKNILAGKAKAMAPDFWDGFPERIHDFEDGEIYAVCQRLDALERDLNLRYLGYENPKNYRFLIYLGGQWHDPKDRWNDFLGCEPYEITIAVVLKPSTLLLNFFMENWENHVIYREF